MKDFTITMRIRCPESVFESDKTLKALPGDIRSGKFQREMMKEWKDSNRGRVRVTMSVEGNV
jgi:ketol-acid reductoisomerase